MIKPLKILFKYPSRGRPEKFFQGLDSIIDNLEDKDNYQILCSFDIDDLLMRDALLNKEENYPNTIAYYGTSKSKVDAINRDICFADEWDIIVVMSDDMKFNVYGFDTIIRQQFLEYGLDTLIHIPDPDAKHFLATMYIAGRTYYERFGFVYNPVYLSLFCDNEVQEIAMMLGKYRYVDFPGIITHLNPAYGHAPKDEMFINQQEIGWTVDQITYEKRKLENFYIKTNNNE
jgi:hypothetical protein